MTRLIRTLLISSLILALGIAPAFALDIPARINDSTAPIYAKSGESASLEAGTGVHVTALKEGWAQISYKDHVGYIRTKYLDPNEGITGYVKKSAYVYKSASTSSEKRGPLAVGTELKVVGVDGDFALVIKGGAHGYIAKSALSKSKPSEASVIASKVELVDWSNGSKLFPKGHYYNLYDIKSGLTVRVYRLGGSKHAELEPATSEDTAKLLSMGGGKFSWDSRPVILFTGSKLIAAAINTMPHGSEYITDNNFDGQFCLHLPGSKTHGTDAENTNHQAAIKYAYAWAQSKG